MDKTQREKLTELIEAEGGTNWWNPQEFKDHVRSQLPIELDIVSVPPSPAANFNCFVYALDLENNSEFLGGRNPIQKEFIRYLLAEKVLKRIENPSEGDLIFYEDDKGVITHAGIVQSDDSILSKWMWGALFAHKTWDVPSSFGDKIFYTKPLSAHVAKEEYIKYRDNGADIEPIG